MANIFLGWPNRIDAATLSGGSWSDSLPLSFLQVRSHSAVARAVDATTGSTVVKVDFGAPKTLRGFGIANHNLSKAATVAVKLGTTDGGDDVYDSGALPAYAVDFDSEMLEWQDYAWWDQIAVDDYIGSPFPFLHVSAQSFEARYLTIEIDDTTNPAGYVQLGRLFAGGGFLPTWNAAYGLGDGFEARSEIVDLESGGIAAWQRRQRRIVRFGFERISLDEGEILHEMMRRASTHGEVLYVPNYADMRRAQRTGFIGRLKQMNPLAYPMFRNRSLQFEIGEVV